MWDILWNIGWFGIGFIAGIVVLLILVNLAAAAAIGRGLGW